MHLKKTSRKLVHAHIYTYTSQFKLPNFIDIFSLKYVQNFGFQVK
jgi:hypothetical protein